MSHASDVSSNLANLLPTGTFLTFQAVAPIFTNNGNCHSPEKVVTGFLVGFFVFICIILNYSDSVTTSKGKLYYGIVTRKGLFNPQFKRSNIKGVTGSCYNADPKYYITVFDTVNAVLSVAVFATLSLLTPPVSTCFFPSIPTTYIKTVPVLVGIIVGFYFSFAPAPRRGVGFAMSGLTHVADEHDTDPDAALPTKTDGTNPGTGTQSPDPQDPKIKMVDDTPVQRIGTTVKPTITEDSLTQRTGTTVKSNKPDDTPTQRIGTTVKSVDTSR